MFIHLRQELAPKQAVTFFSLVKRRLNREPSAYIIGHREFYGLDFLVTTSVLIPRPETELIVEKAIDTANRLYYPNCLIADIGTGSGNIAIALAANLPQVKIYAADVSDSALEIARINSQKHALADRIIFLRGNLASPLPEPVHMIVANLPYIKEAELAQLMPEISQFEPAAALDGGDDGLNKIEELLSQAGKRLLQNGVILLEIGHDQGKAVYELAKTHFPNSDIVIYPDLAGIDRVLSIVNSG